jgi:hypothetical protein
MGHVRPGLADKIRTKHASSSTRRAQPSLTHQHACETAHTRWGRAVQSFPSRRRRPRALRRRPQRPEAPSALGRCDAASAHTRAPCAAAQRPGRRDGQDDRLRLRRDGGDAPLCAPSRHAAAARKLPVLPVSDGRPALHAASLGLVLPPLGPGRAAAVPRLRVAVRVARRLVWGGARKAQRGRAV